MKVVILAGGYGTRISEESQFKPKPMIEIGGKPILWHIMKLYSAYGFNDFVICAGYKQEIIKEYFFNYYLHNSDISFDLKNNNITVHSNKSEPWNVSVVDTGLDTMTGGRIKRVKEYLDGEPFFLTYGDGVSNVNIKKLLDFHQNSDCLVTLSAYNIGQRFGVLDVTGDGYIKEFREKTKGDGNLVNIGFMVCEPEFIDYIEKDSDILEKDVMSKIANINKLMAYKHNGFWSCMDTKREHDALEKMWTDGNAMWKVWKD